MEHETQLANQHTAAVEAQTRQQAEIAEQQARQQAEIAEQQRRAAIWQSLQAQQQQQSQVFKPATTTDCRDNGFGGVHCETR